MSTFKKTERLCSKKEIDTLLKYGKSFSLFPFKIIYHQTERESGSAIPSQPSAKIMISVPKKYFKRAVKRNLLKRRIREAYRINKQLLICNEINLSFMILYNARVILEYPDIEIRIREILGRLSTLNIHAGKERLQSESMNDTTGSLHKQRKSINETEDSLQQQTSGRQRTNEKINGEPGMNRQVPEKERLYGLIKIMGRMSPLRSSFPLLLKSRGRFLRKVP